MGPLKDAFAALKILTLPVVGLWFLPCNRISQRPHQHMFFSSEGYRCALSCEHIGLMLSLQKRITFFLKT
jgi:hypothetical protein